jgi:glycolate oxidase FAD binding subunit
MTSLTEFQDRIRGAVARQLSLDIRGGNTKGFLGGAQVGDSLDVSGYRGIVSYEPTELVITARCGTPLHELEAALAEKGQCLPFEPPHFGPNATVGGMLSAGLAGPSRAYAGGARDYVLGAQMINGRAELLTFGGQVMKNVAGYDVSRVLAGAMGILGVVTEASLKVLPLAPASLTLRFDMNEAEAIKALNRWAGKPLPLNASCWYQGMLYLRLRGAAPALASARSILGGVEVDASEAGKLWSALREQQHEFFTLSEQHTLWRISVPPTTAPLAMEDGLMEWGGGQRWMKLHHDDASLTEKLQAAACLAGGYAQRFRGGARNSPSLTQLTPAIAAIHQRLKLAFDPHRVFNRGRLYDTL